MRGERKIYRIAWVMDECSPFEFVVGNKHTRKAAESQIHDANRQAGKEVAKLVSADTVSKRRKTYAHQCWDENHG